MIHTPHYTPFCKSQWGWTWQTLQVWNVHNNTISHCHVANDLVTHCNVGIRLAIWLQMTIMWHATPYPPNRINISAFHHAQQSIQLYIH